MTQTQLTAEKRPKEIYLILLSIPRGLLLYSNNPVIHSRISAQTTRLTSLERQEVCTTGPWEEVHNLKIATILSQMPLRLRVSAEFSAMMTKVKTVVDPAKREATLL